MLTEIEIKAAKPQGKAYRLTDGGGLYLYVSPTGARSWRLKYRFKGQDRAPLCFGLYPAISLKRARDLQADAKRDLREGRDPRDTMGAGKAETDTEEQGQPAEPPPAETFRLAALDYLAHREGQDAKSRSQDQRRLEMYIFGKLPAGHCPKRLTPIDLTRLIGDQRIDDLEALDLLGPLRAIEAAGRKPLAHKIKTLCSSIFKYGVATGACRRNPVAELAGAIKRRGGGHFASVQEPRRIGELLRAIDGYEGQPETHYALRLQPLVFLRSSTLRTLHWSDVDFERAEIRVGFERMKKKRTHVVPLCRQAMVLLRELQPLSATRSALLFPGLRSSTRPISNGTLNAALRRMGYTKTDQTTHGFRSIADTHLHEMGYPHAMIKVQMSHLATEDDTDAAYNYAQFLNDPDTGRRPRHEMMQAWADYLDKLRLSLPNNSNVVPISGAAA